MANVLILEDEADVRNFIAVVLRSEGHTVWEARTAAEASRICQDKEVDLLVTNILLPGENGIEFALRLVDARPRIRVIFVSGFPVDWNAERGRNVRAMPVRTYSVLQKPFSPTELSAAVSEMLRKQKQVDLARMLRSCARQE